MILSALALALLSAPAGAADAGGWIVRNKVALGTTAREPASSAVRRRER